MWIDLILRAVYDVFIEFNSVQCQICKHQKIKIVKAKDQ